MQPVLVIRDERFKDHLEKIPHLESLRRIRAIHQALNDPSIRGKWAEPKPRHALNEEFSWVHTADYIGRVARSAGRPLTSFDFDTQATENSYDVARSAAGGVFSLLDAIWAR
ncbi:MAG: hypothetical protein PVG99_13270 [Desulfobacteraceae bacterium]|jgi:acetoin utilization deacetylase AcuC-like enzyme